MLARSKARVFTPEQIITENLCWAVLKCVFWWLNTAPRASSQPHHKKITKRWLRHGLVTLMEIQPCRMHTRKLTCGDQWMYFFHMLCVLAFTLKNTMQSTPRSSYDSTDATVAHMLVLRLLRTVSNIFSSMQEVLISRIPSSPCLLPVNDPYSQRL